MMDSVQQEIIDYGGIENYLHNQQHKTLLRFLTCGSVDDGKSTLIGRLLHDTQHIYDDQLSMLRRDSNYIDMRKDQLDLALLIDGLQSERTQGITIDVAYRYFGTRKRKFIIADTPGHEEYTRNMVTAASNSEVAILLVDARKGMQHQTRRHWFINALMGIRYIIVAVNKMDLINYNQEMFQKINEKCLQFNQKLFTTLNVEFVPISALNGENVVLPSQNMSWYNGPTLLNILEKINTDYSVDIDMQELRFPIQYVIRDHLDFRGYAGTVASGSIHVGQRVKIFPSNTISTIQRIIKYNQDQMYSWCGDAVTITLEDNVDLSRGDMLIDSNVVVAVTHNALVDVVWMNKRDLKTGQYFDIKITNKIVRAHIKAIQYHIDMNTLSHQHINTIPFNGIGLVELLFDQSLVLDKYSSYPMTGNMIFIDILTNETVGAGMVRSPIMQTKCTNKKYSEFELALHSLIRCYFPHWNVHDLL